MNDPELIWAPGLRRDPREELPPSVQEQLPAQVVGVVRREGAREEPLAADEAGWRLLQLFDEPTSVSDAVAIYCTAYGQEVSQEFAAASRWIGALRERGYLVPAGGDGAPPLLEPGARVGGWRIRRLLRKTAGSAVAMLQRSEASGESRGEAAFAVGKIAWSEVARTRQSHERAVLEPLQDWKRVPALVGPFVGRQGDPQVLPMQYVPGLALHRVVEQLPRRSGRVALAIDLVRCFEELHQLGFLHGDVQAGNLLLGRDEQWRLVDFEYAASLHDGEAPPRAGLAWQLEPEAAAALLEGRAPPPVSTAGEQYAVATLVYELLSGRRPLELAVEREQALRQLQDEEPRAFSDLGVQPWPEAEQVLARALSKDANARYPSLGDFRRALEELAVRSQHRSRGTGDACTLAQSPQDSVEDDWWQRLGPDSPVWREGLPHPTVSVHLGAAGVAFLALQLCETGVYGALELARLWWERARADLELDRAKALQAPRLGVHEEVVGSGGVFHGALGVHWVGWRIARASSDDRLRVQCCSQIRRSVEKLLTAPAGPADVLTGDAGALLVCAEGIGGGETGLEAVGSQLRPRILASLREDALVAERGEPVALGFAHGIAGKLYALARWHREVDALSSVDLPQEFGEGLRVLLAAAEPQERGLRWPWHEGDPSGRRSMAGWCGGAAGLLRWWSLVSSLDLDPPQEAHLTDHLKGRLTWKELGEGTAWSLVDAPWTEGSVCCGALGGIGAIADAIVRGGLDREEWTARIESWFDQALSPEAEFTFDDAFPHSWMRGEWPLLWMREVWRSDLSLERRLRALAAFPLAAGLPSLR